MKQIGKQFMLGLTTMILMLSCSNNKNDIIEENGKINIEHGLEFNVDFPDYNSDVEVSATRSNIIQGTSGDTLSKQIVPINNDMYAEVVIKKDLMPRKNIPTRSLENGTYTMLAYKSGQLKGEVTGSVYYNKFHTTMGAVELDPGTYQFVLFNDKLTREGNHLIVGEDDVEKALIGRTTYTVSSTPSRQQVTFQMKHCGARFRIKIESYTPIVSPTANKYTNGAEPSTAIYDAVTGMWSIGDTFSNFDGILTFSGNNNPDANGIYSVVSNYTYVLYSSYVHDYRFNIGRNQTQTYNKKFNLITSLPISMAPILPNHSYLISYKLKFNYLYLMSDGTTGYFNQTTYGGGNKTPIAIVVNANKRLAMALHDTENGRAYQWTTNHDFYYRPVNIDQSPDIEVLKRQENGYQETWDGNYSTSIVTGERVKALRSDFPPFKAAAEYTPGVPLTGTLVGKKWFLPSIGEAKYVYTLGFGEINRIDGRQGKNYKDKSVNAALKQVGGQELITSTYNPNGDYFTSSEGGLDKNHPLKYAYGSVFYCSPGYFIVEPQSKYSGSEIHVRAFIRY